MLFNFFLIILFAGSIGLLWHRISEKIPELVAIPDEVIVARLHEDSARVRIFLLHARTFWREPRYRQAFWRFCEKIMYRVHIALMRTDNAVSTLLKKIRGYGGIAAANGSEEPVNGVIEEKETIARIAVAEPPRPQAPRMQEVRRKKKEKVLPA